MRLSISLSENSNLSLVLDSGFSLLVSEVSKSFLSSDSVSSVNEMFIVNVFRFSNGDMSGSVSSSNVSGVSFSIFD